MAKDAELDRLKAAQDLAFQRKQTAHETMQRAWERRRSAADAMNRAFEAKQSAYQDQDRSWNEIQRLQSSNGSRIDQLSSLQESAYQKMKGAFESASSAHDRRDGGAAASYAASGHRYKAEAKGYVEERRRLVGEIRAARDRHDPFKTAFQRAKEAFTSAKRTFDSAKAEHERAQSDFKKEKEAFDKASAAFKTRLEHVREENKKRNQNRQELAEKAGVPFEYRDKVWVTKKSDGVIHLYFGGVGTPDGPGHGHYVMDISGKVTYKRDPFDPHGAQNVVRDENLELRLSQAALAAFTRNRSSTGPWQDQYDDGTVTVKVKSGFNRRTSSIATDVIVIDRSSNPDEHLHMILSEHDGSVLFQEWRKNH